MSSEEPGPAGLQVHELVVRMEGRTVIDGVSLAVREGDRLAVMGPSGVGKSTLLRAIAGLIDIDAGTVTLDGRTPDQVGFPRWRRQVTYVAQAPAQLGMSARRWLDALASLGSQSAGVLGAVDIAREWGVEPALWDRPFGRLSGGERQRVHVAIAVASAPRVLLLDEPTTGLDADAVRRMEHTLRGLTSVWVTHDVEQARRVGTDMVELS